MREAWADAPTASIIAPHCPLCLALRPIIVRSEQNGDGSVTRKAVCRECSQRIKIVVELPIFGSADCGGLYDAAGFDITHTSKD